jgi:SMODS and SLOG-associating 2TM effector domain 1/SMODS and SLOG-associating 2TM effector domain 3
VGKVLAALRDEDFPAVYRCSDAISMRAQRRFLATTGSALGLVAFAAVMGAVSAPWAGWVGAGAFLLAVLVGALAITQNLERAWYDGRALAESAKSLTWLYSVRGGDLAALSSPEDVFRARLRALSGELERLDFVMPVEGPEISDRMREIRAAPLSARREIYLEYRVRDQISYYRKRGAQHGRDARRFRKLTWFAEAFGIAGAVLKATSTLSVDLLGIGAAAAAAATAWLQTRDHVTVERAYELTARDLDAVIEDVPDGEAEQAWAAFVVDAETAMSREHVMWLARRSRLTRVPH